MKIATFIRKLAKSYKKNITYYATYCYRCKNPKESFSKPNLAVNQYGQVFTI